MGAPDPTDDGDYQWWVPVNFAIPGDSFSSSFSSTSPKAWLRPGGGKAKVGGMPHRDRPVVFNVQQTGESDNIIRGGGGAGIEAAEPAKRLSRLWKAHNGGWEIIVFPPN